MQIYTKSLQNKYLFDYIMIFGDETHFLKCQLLFFNHYFKIILFKNNFVALIKTLIFLLSL